MKMKKNNIQTVDFNTAARGGICIAVFRISAASAAAGIGKPYDARQGIVLVRAMVSNGQSVTGGQGTGWAVGAPGQQVEYIVTNGHVGRGGLCPSAAEQRVHR